MSNNNNNNNLPVPTATIPANGENNLSASSKSHSFFTQIANYAVSGYDKATNYVDNDAVKGVLVSQRGNFETVASTAASLSTQAVEAIASGAQKVVKGDHHFQPEPLPNWLNPRDPIFSVPSTLPFFIMYTGVAMFHRPIAEVISSPNYNLLFFSVPRENETNDPKYCGPKIGEFEPRFGRILCKIGILKKTDVNCAPSGQSSPGGGASRNNLIQQVAEYNRTHPSETPRNDENATNNTTVRSNNKSDSGFDMISDWNLGGTHASPNQTARNNATATNDNNNTAITTAASTAVTNAASAIGNAVTNAVSSAVESIQKNDDDDDDVVEEDNNTTDDNNEKTMKEEASASASASSPSRQHIVTVTSPHNESLQQQQQQQNSRSHTMLRGLKNLTHRIIESLHPNFLFTTKKNITTNEETVSPRIFISYHLVGAAFFSATAITSLIGLRRVAKREGVDVNKMIPPLARMARDVLPISWTGGVVERFGKQPADLSSTLQFGLTFGAFGALVHLIPGLTQFILTNFVDAKRNNNSNNNNNSQSVVTVAAHGTEEEEICEELSSVSGPNKYVNYSTLATHYTSLIFDLNIALQLCVMSPSLPPIVKLWPALYFTLVTRKFYLCDDKNTTSYFGSHSRWILYFGAVRHFSMLCESTPKNNNFAAHVFPRLLSLALLPIHLSAFWLPMHPVRAFDEENGGLLRTMFGGMTGTAWSPAALSVSNLAWVALYFSQGTNSMDDACPRVNTMGQSTLPIPLYLAGVEIIAAIGKLLSQVV